MCGAVPAFVYETYPNMELTRIAILATFNVNKMIKEGYFYKKRGVKNKIRN